jgi:hypothetical protein
MECFILYIVSDIYISRPRLPDFFVPRIGPNQLACGIVLSSFQRVRILEFLLSLISL